MRMRIIEKKESAEFLRSDRLELKQPCPNDQPKITRSGERPWRAGAARQRAVARSPPTPGRHALPARLDDHVEGLEG